MGFWSFLGGFAIFNAICDALSSTSHSDDDDNINNHTGQGSNVRYNSWIDDIGKIDDELDDDDDF